MLVLAASFLDQIDYFVVQVALPTIESQFGSTLADAQWIIGGYGITLAGFLLLSGRAGDSYGQKRVFVSGMALFTFASLAAGFAPSLLLLVIFRLVQGIGAAMTTVTALAIFFGLFRDEKDRIRYYGIFVTSFSAGAATGLIAGGVLTDFFGWRSIFFFNVPIGLGILTLSQRYLRSDENKGPRRKLDLPGAVTVTGGLVVFVYAMTNAANVGFLSPGCLLPLFVSASVFVGFAIIEFRSEFPLVPLRFVLRPEVLTINALCFFVTLTAGVTLLLTVYFQSVLGWSPLLSGIGLLPVTVTFSIGGGWAAARVQSWLGLRRTLLVSLTMMTAGAIVLTRISTAGNYLVNPLPGMIIFAIGTSFVFPAIFAEASVTAKQGEEGLASGIINTSFRVAIPVGIAIILETVSYAGSLVGSVDPSSTSSGLTVALQYGFAAAAVICLVSLAIALRVRDSNIIPSA